MYAISHIGASFWSQWDELRHAAAVIGTALGLAVLPRYWARPVRKLFAGQVLAVGVEPFIFVCGVAVLVGFSVVVQLAFWTGKAGQSQLLGPLPSSARPSAAGRSGSSGWSFLRASI